MNNKQKILYLVRHAKSSWTDDSLSDIDRPLNGRGRKSAPEMGMRLRQQGHRPDFIISSPANRAYSTACLIAKELDFDEADIVTHKNMYFAGLISITNMLEKLDDHYQKVMIVGHNPVMTSLMNTLANTSTINMPTCAIAMIGFDIASWTELDSVDGNLLGYDYPKGSGSFTE